jgi:hydrogenase maturation protease
LYMRAPGKDAALNRRDKEDDVRTTVIGMGNLLLGDEGVGVHAARLLTRDQQPPGTEVLEIGSAILDALPALRNADRVIVLDAVMADGPPGTVYRLPFTDCERPSHIGSLHGFDFSRVMALAGRKKPQEVLVLGVEPATIAWSMELSPQVANALPRLLTVVKEDIRRGRARWGAS